MALRLSSLRADLKRENEGDWVEIPDFPGLKLKVRSFNYGPFVTAKSLVDQRNQRRYFSKRKDAPPEELYELNARLYLDHILLDWDGLDGDDGKPVPFAKAEEILLDPAFRVLHDGIRYAGLLLSQVDADYIEDVRKNSPPPSAGSSESE
jgi:hypothetical protein